MQKISEETKISYISYINYSEDWILILRLIIRQNLCRIVTQAYMNPTWKKKCRIASPSKSQAKEERTQTTQTRLRRSAQSLPPDGGLRGLCSFPNKAGDKGKNITRWITVMHDYPAKIIQQTCINHTSALQASAWQ